MRPFATLSRSAVFALIVLAGSHIASAQSTAPAGDAKAGHATFDRVGCYQCHGTVGQGSGYHGIGAFGPMLAPHPLPYSAVLTQLRRPRGVMPPYSTAILTDQDVANIYAYLESIPAGKPAADNPMLRGYLTH